MLVLDGVVEDEFGRSVGAALGHGFMGRDYDHAFYC
jgi:hypothetical protein